MKNKTKLAFELLEQEMEVICKEDQLRFIGGSGGYTWQQIVDAINSGNFGLIPAGTFVNDGNSLTYFGENLNEVIVLQKTPAAGSSSGYTSWDWTNTMTGGSGSFWLSSSGYSDGGSTGGGSSSTNLDSSNFRFDPEDNYEVLFPEFTKTVNNVANYVSSNPKVMETLKQYTGLNEMQIIEKLTSDQGPTVKIHQLDGNYGFHNPFTNTVEIDIDYVNQLEYSTGEKGEVLNLMLTITLLHEFVHWTDGLFFNYTQENGNNWEIATYGFVVNMGNVALVKL